MKAARAPYEQQAAAQTLHILCERDVGLFSLIQQVIANVPWALAENRIPVAHFKEGCSYFCPEGHRDADTVWEYYFEPIVPDWPAARIPLELQDALREGLPGEHEVGRDLGDGHFATCHFGDHPSLHGRSLFIPYLWDDPDSDLRKRCAEVIRAYVRPRPYIEEAVSAFLEEKLPGAFIGLHIRGTDAVSKQELRAHRRGSLSFPHYIRAIRRGLVTYPDARIFVATDSESSLERIRDEFGERVVAHPSLRHQEGDSVGRGPEGGLMPSYVTSDAHAAARNGEEAVLEYRLLCESALLIHNGSGLARTVLLARPELPHVNTHLARSFWVFGMRNAQRVVQGLRRFGLAPQ